MSAATIHPPDTTVRRFLPVAKLAISVALIAVLLTRVNVGELWATVRGASPAWLGTALAIYSFIIVVSAWRWGLLLRAQSIELPLRRLTASFLVATFFNNFLPSNIGGDVVRVTDTARAAGSKTLATTIVLIDRALGLLGLALVAALGATAARSGATRDLAPVEAGVLWAVFALAVLLVAPAILVPGGVSRLLEPLRRIRSPWMNERIERLLHALHRFSAAPAAIAACFGGALAVQAGLVAFYLAIARSMSIPIGIEQLAVIVPVSFILQMAPISVNGLGIREATFGFYFSRVGLSLESALVVSLLGAALIMMFSLSGAGLYALRSRDHQPAGIPAELDLD